MWASFLFNLFACLFNVGALILNGGSNPVAMVVNSVCVGLCAGLALMSLKHI